MRYLPIFAIIISLLASGLVFAQTLDKEPRLQPGDRIRVTVLNEPDETRDAIIDKDGTIQLALLGSVQLSDLTAAEAAELIKKLLTDYILEPEVSVELLESGKVRVFVVGEVQKPGVYVLDRGARALEALTQAGYTENSDLSNISVQRGSQTVPIDLTKFLTAKDLTANMILSPDDTIIVSRHDLGHSVLVLGEVTKAGATPFVSGMTVKELIEACGGAKPEADLSQITIKRSGSQEVIPVNFASISSGGMAGNTMIYPGDTVMIPKSESLYFIVEGAVNSPGRYCICPGMTVEDALAAAGGLTKEAKIDCIQIAHARCGTPVCQMINLKSIRCGSCPMVCVQPRDVIVVPVKKSKPSFLEVIAAVGALGWVFVH